MAVASERFAVRAPRPGGRALSDTLILNGDVRRSVPMIADESVHCVVTSPPYFGLRDYGTSVWVGGDPACKHRVRPFGRSFAGAESSPKQQTNNGSHAGATGTCVLCGAARSTTEIGQEASLAKHIDVLVDVFREIRRVLRPDGVVWLNYGDAYAASPRGNRQPGGGALTNSNNGSDVEDSRWRAARNRPNPGGWRRDGFKPKDLMLAGSRLAVALQQPHLECSGCRHVAHERAWGRFPNGRRICPRCNKSRGAQIETPGWWVRSEIAWCKGNPMPESVLDRPTCAHEKVFLLAKSRRYFYDADAVRTPPKYPGDDRRARAKADHKTAPTALRNGIRPPADHPADPTPAPVRADGSGHSRPSSWATSPYYREQDPRYPKREVRGRSTYGRQTLGGNLPESERRRGRDKQRGHGRRHAGFNDRWDGMGKSQQRQMGANLRNVWNISTKPFPGAHFATFPAQLAELCVLAGTSAKGACANCGAPWRRVARREGARQPLRTAAAGWHVPAEVIEQALLARTVDWVPTCGCASADVVPCTVLDPFGGSGTVGVVAARLGRRSVLIELNAEYAEMAAARIHDDAPMFNEVVVERVRDRAAPVGEPHDPQAKKPCGTAEAVNGDGPARR